MEAARYSRFGGPDVLEIVDLPDPHAGPGQIRIAVHAAGINPTDWKLRKGLLGGELPQTTGREVAGVVDGVGSAAVQLAVARGARVIGTASPANHDYLRSLGAEPVAYGEGLVERVHALTPDGLPDRAPDGARGGIDAALDVAGSGVLPELIELVGGPAHVVTITDFDGAREHGVTFSSGDAAGRAIHALAGIGELTESGRFSLPVAQTFPLAEIAQAHRVSEDGHVRGKLVLLVG